MNSKVDAIRSSKYLYLHSIYESEDEALRVVLHEAKVGRAPSAEVLAQELLPEVRKLLS